MNNNVHSYEQAGLLRSSGGNRLFCVLSSLGVCDKHQSVIWRQFAQVSLTIQCYIIVCHHPFINTLRPRQNGRHFADDILKCIFLNGNVWILIKISLKFVPKGPINNIPTLVQIMAWCRPGDKPLSESMMVSLLTHIYVTRPQWVNSCPPGQNVHHFADDIFRCFFVNE